MKEVEWQKLLDEALTVEGNLGNTYNRFYRYSITNQLLLYLQGVKEPVATYKKWRELGRQVNKGSKAKAIIRPYIFKNEDGEEEIKGFGLRNCLFGLSETTGEELPAVELPAWNYYTALNKLDITEIEFEMLDGNVQGYAKKRQLAINPVAADETATAMHEIAHIVLGHTEQQGYSEHRGIMEMEAEAVAYILQNELYLAEPKALAESRAYIQGWIKNDKPSDKNIQNIFKAADKIIKAGQ